MMGSAEWMLWMVDPKEHILQLARETERIFTLHETIMEVEYSLFIEEFSLPRGLVPLPCLFDGG